MINTCAWILDDDQPCGEMCEGKTMFCGSHNRQLRKEKESERKQLEKRKSLLQKAQSRNLEPRKMPKKVSPKREELNKEYAVLRPQYLLENPTCEVKLIGCEGESVEIHHTYSGSNKVAHLNDTTTWKATCSHCHRTLHDKLSAKESRELGLKI